MIRSHFSNDNPALCVGGNLSVNSLAWTVLRLFSDWAVGLITTAAPLMAPAQPLRGNESSIFQGPGVLVWEALPTLKSVRGVAGALANSSYTVLNAGRTGHAVGIGVCPVIFFVCIRIFSFLPLICKCYILPFSCKAELASTSAGSCPSTSGMRSRALASFLTLSSRSYWSI